MFILPNIKCNVSSGRFSEERQDVGRDRPHFQKQVVQSRGIGLKVLRLPLLCRGALAQRHAPGLHVVLSHAAR